jgi:hypothetical protein
MNRCEYRNLAAQMKCSVFCDITPCSQLKVNRRFGGSCRFHLQSSASYLLDAGFFLGLLFDPGDGDDIFLRNIRWLSTDYRGDISQRAKLFITTAVRISDSANYADNWRTITTKFMEFGAPENFKHVYKIYNKHYFVGVWVRLCPDLLFGPHNLVCNGYRGPFPLVKAAGAWSWPLTSS